MAENKDKRLVSFVVLLDERSEANKTKLAELAKTNALSIPLTIAMDGARGPRSYKLNPKAQVTVLLSRRNVVKANFALADSPTDADVQAVIKAAQEMLGN